MPAALLNCKPNTTIPLPERGGVPASAHILDQESIDAVNAALATGRPLLVRGEPGTGKSQLARAAAEAMGRVLVSHAVDARTETRDLLWSVDAVARLAEAQVLGAMCEGDLAEAKRRIAVGEFVHPGPLWWAFDWTSALEQAKRTGVSAPFQPDDWTVDKGVVVLVDEIDKADPSVPNGLLDALGHGRFDVPGREPVVMDRSQKPLVIITTNEERALPDAFLRRCWVLHLPVPEDLTQLLTYLKDRGRAHFTADDLTDEVLSAAAQMVAKDRQKAKGRGVSAPGLAEYIDLLHAVKEQESTQAAQLTLLIRIGKFALEKHPPEVGA
ncbi:MAG: MoxR family ATPase [Polyangiaceae bacterium]|nr:MoxR family ATPase [Polyangiaceae bacterium]